jgi:SAM-dependent methyltransferase
LRAIAAPICALCGAGGLSLYRGLLDRLFAAPGIWDMVCCPARQCGLVWLDPMPAPEDLHVAYASYYTHGDTRARESRLARLFASAKQGYVANHYNYDASAIDRLLGVLPWFYPGRVSELDFSVMWLHAGARGRLLDIGAGSGWLVEHMGALGWQAEGLDFDARAVAQAREKGLRMHQGDLLEQRFGDCSFDALTMSHSIEHVHDPNAWLAEAHRILKPGGRLALATPNTRSLLHRRFGMHWFALDPPRHLHLFNRGALALALRKAGFRRFRIWSSSRDANGAFIGSRSIRATGRFDMLAQQPMRRRVAGRLFQLFEVACLAVDADAGEDLVALAEG